MESQSKEKKRVFNIIWNAAEDYSFQPEFMMYDHKGVANLYWNYILGAVRRYYDYPLIQGFLNSLQSDPNHAFYESLTWLGLENCTYEKGKKDRLALEDLRRSYALSVVRREDPPSFYFLVDEIKTAHFQRVLGEEPAVREAALNILNDLEFPETLDTEQIIARMAAIIQAHFPLSRNGKTKNFFQNLLPRKWASVWGQHSPNLLPNSFSDSSILNLFNTGSQDYSQALDDFEKKEGENHRHKRIWRDLKDHWAKKQRAYIQHYYGASILSDAQIQALEKVICVDNHANCHIHFTRGEFGANAITRCAGVMNQRERNKAHYYANRAGNSISIEKLTQVIRNSLLITVESAAQRAKAGSLVAGKVWQNLYLHEDRVFQRRAADEIGNLSVDVLLDASGSQVDRQESIAAQAYILAESLTRCRIPVRVVSFCTNRNFTVFHLLREYDSLEKNEAIFHYYASGCNRDGLAIRTARHLLRDSTAEYKILILLSDGKPLDPQGFPEHGLNPDAYMYADSAAVSDVAAEVRKTVCEGSRFLCVFSGAEEDIPLAKKMYGNQLVCVQSPERFADQVGVWMRNVLKSF